MRKVVVKMTLFTLLAACSSSDDNRDFVVAGSGEANYEITFKVTWSQDTHPQNFPSNPHFSGLIGALHNVNVSLWSADSLASAGIEQMAETGSKSILLTEMEPFVDSGDIDKIISGGGVNPAPGDISFSVAVKQSHPYLSIVSMLAPSPDWFVGLNAYHLQENGNWVENKSIDLYVYDAGTDDGSEYASANADSNPKQLITKIEDIPFSDNGTLKQVGQFIIQRVDP